jgi:hypothetical protein
MQVFRTAFSGTLASSSSGKMTDSHQHSVVFGSAATAQRLGSPQSGQIAVFM